MYFYLHFGVAELMLLLEINDCVIFNVAEMSFLQNYLFCVTVFDKYL